MNGAQAGEAGESSGAAGESSARDAAPGPVLIAGCGRSGTSYLRSLLDAHHDLAIPSESLFLVDYLRFADRVPHSLWRSLLAREPQLLCWHTGPLPIRGTCRETLLAVNELYAVAQGARRWGQKTPRFVRWRRLLDTAFPDCRWILIHRDPRAVAASMKASGQHTHAVARAVRRWRRDNAEIVALVAGNRCPGNVMIIAYRELVEELEETLRRILAFAGLESVASDVLIANARPVFFSRSRFAMNTVRQGMQPDETRSNDWTQRLTAREVRYIESVCRYEMQVLGYEPQSASIGHGIFDGLAAWWPALRDPWIPLRYLYYWPEYPIWTAIRAASLRLASVPGFRWGNGGAA